ncbi:MAG: ABC transporter permease [Stackebrandtia sp.]
MIRRLLPPPRRGARRASRSKKAGGDRERGRAQVLGILSEALASLRGRMVRAWLTAAGIAMGIAATVATVGLSSTAQGAVSDEFDAAKATQVVASFNDSLVENETYPTVADADRVRKLNGVVDAGLMCGSNEDRTLTLSEGSEFSVKSPVSAMEPQAMKALGVEIVDGRAYDSGHGARGDAVVMVDEKLAEDLGITDVSEPRRVYIDEVPYLLTGIYSAPEGETSLTRAAMVPAEQCLGPNEDYGTPEAAIRTELGAADKVAKEADLALWPRDPSMVKVAKPPDLRNFRERVESNLQSLLLGLAGVSLVIGAISVSNTALVSVMERRSEIGLRRAIGASRKAISGQFVCESAVIGVVGGVVGTVIGVNVTAGVSLAQEWQVSFHPLLLAAGPVVGALVGVVAGVYPAWRASRVAPAVTLRSLPAAVS